MNAGTIWWSQIGNSLRLLANVTNHLRDCRSAVLRVPANFPWRQDFYEAVDVRRSAFSAEKRMMRLQWEDNADPGEFILDELCSIRIRADYWPGQTYAEYLGSREDLLLNDYYVWVTGVHTKTDAAKWAEFITQYDRAARQDGNRAVYIIEYDGPGMEVFGVEKILYTVENYDCRVFCLETAAAMDNTDLHAYQAELALSIGDRDPELCYELITRGVQLLQDPVQAAVEALELLGLEGRTEQSIVSAAWKAAIILLFPILEQHRMEFVTRHRSALARHLPINNSNGDRITDPCDLEIGALYYITHAVNTDFTAEEQEQIKFCRKVRNLLAHNKLVPYDDVRAVLSL